MNLARSLATYACTLRASVRWYDDSRLRESRSFALAYSEDGSCGATLFVQGAEWECHFQAVPIAGRTDGLALQATFRLTSGTAQAAGVGVDLEFEGWSTDNYVLLPAAVYNGNRFRCLPLRYPPLLRDPAEHRADPPITVTDVPRLNLEAGPSRLQQTTGDPATPAMGFYDPQAQRGFWLLTRQQTRFGNSGLFVEESADRRRATFTVTAPCVRETRQAMARQVPGEDRGAAWVAGDAVTLDLRLYFFAASRQQALFDRFCEIRQDLSGPAVLSHRLPFSNAWEIQEEKYNRDNWNADQGYYSVGTRENMAQDWQLGWVGGCMVTLALLWAGSDLSRQRAWQNLDTILSKTQAPSGFFYGIGDGKTWYGDSFGREPHPRNMHMTRKSADALYFLLKQFMLLGKMDPERPIPPAWLAAVRRLADAFVRLWERYGQFGQFVDVETGELVVGGSTSAAIAPAGLALAGVYLDCHRYRQVAEEAARLYYERDVQKGLTTAGPGEILQGPDSESAFGMLESFVVLYELTRRPEWRAAAQDMARQCATWCVSYDYVFPPQSLFGQLDMRTAGAVYANVQNKHGAPGICTLSGDSLFKLFRATGDRFFLDLLRDTAHNLPQYLSRADRPIGGMPSGWMNERVNLSDWEGSKQVGGVFYGSCWPEVSLMLTWVEVPGLYVQPDTGLVCAVDHITAEVLEQTSEGLALRLANPTAFPARIRTWVETAAEAQEPMGFNGLWDRPLVSLAAGEQQVFHVDRLGGPLRPAV